MKWIVLAMALMAILTLGACKKKVAPAPPPPPPPPPPAPTASLTADPATIEKGQSTTLTWQTSDATDVSIDTLGSVQPNGSQSVSPSESTTYRLAAKGPGGTQEATARVTVTAPPHPTPGPPPAQPNVSEQQLFEQNIKDAFFDYDKYDIRSDAQQALTTDAAFLKENPGIKFTIEGHCDERGSTEYNLALGDNRAAAAKQFLVQQGVGADRIKTVSFGKEKPVCTESNEGCWQQNRRAHFVYGQQ